MMLKAASPAVITESSQSSEREFEKRQKSRNQSHHMGSMETTLRSYMKLSPASYVMRAS